MCEHPWHPQIYQFPAIALFKRIKNILRGWLFEKSLTHVYPVVVLLVFQVDISIAVDRVNAVEDNGKSGTAPDVGDEEANVQIAVSDINAYVDRDHLQAHCKLDLGALRRVNF